MKSEMQIEKIAELFMQTGHAHHEAFIATDGFDPDWAAWYGVHLEKPLSTLFAAKFAATEIADKLVALDKEFNTKSQSEHWTAYYAREFVDFEG
jgi:hypothetical protein